MNRRRLRPLLLPVGVAFFQNMLLIFGEPGEVTPADMLINAFVSRQTGEFRSAMILAMENTLVLMLFLIFYGDSVAAQQRTGAVYRFSRMADRGAVVLLASHISADIHDLCCRVYRMDRGRLEDGV